MIKLSPYNITSILFYLLMFVAGCATSNQPPSLGIPSDFNPESSIVISGDENAVECVEDGIEDYDQELKVVYLRDIEWQSNPKIIDQLINNSVEYVVRLELKSEVVKGEPNLPKEKDVDGFGEKAWQDFKSSMRIFLWPFVTTPYEKKTHGKAYIYKYDKGYSEFFYVDKLNENVDGKGSFTQFIYPAFPVWWNPAVSEHPVCLKLGEAIAKYFKR